MATNTTRFSIAVETATLDQLTERLNWQHGDRSQFFSQLARAALADLDRLTSKHGGEPSLAELAEAYPEGLPETGEETRTVIRTRQQAIDRVESQYRAMRNQPAGPEGMRKR